MLHVLTQMAIYELDTNKCNMQHTKITENLGEF